MKGLITEMIATKKGIAISDTNAVKESERINLKEVSKVRFLVRVEAGVGTTLVAKIKEHNAAVAGTSQDLVISLPVFSRVDGAACVKAEAPGVAAIAFADLDTAAGYAMVEVDHNDITDGFSHVSIELAAPGAVRLSHVACEIDHERKPAYELA